MDGVARGARSYQTSANSHQLTAESTLARIDQGGGPVGTTMTRKGPKRPDDGSAPTPRRARPRRFGIQNGGGRTDEGMNG
jgi:hypothetical protein